MRNASLSLGLIAAAMLSACTSSNGLVTSMKDGGADGPASGCTDDSQCASPTPRCDKNTSTCVACLPTNDNCPAGQRCLPTNNTFACATSCTTDADCPKADGGTSLACCNAACVDTSGDTDNCGGCGKMCPALPNAASVCAAGLCALGACNTGYANCDNLQANGCEVNAATDAKNCGFCGTACVAGPNQSGACVASACTTTCAMGFTHCSMNPADGCEVQTATDIKNCGGCGSACNMVANASVVCAAGVCSIGVCNGGYADCNMNAADGCEADTQTDAANCGACGKVCPAVANGAPGCNKGVCGVGSCSMGFADCDGLANNGCETSTVADAKNCGACGASCTGANSMQSCQMGACTITSCSPGFADCDGKPNTGCEVSVGSDANNCGGCGKVCMGEPNAMVGCVNAACVVNGCDFGFADCDKNPANGCEANLLQIQNCGACGNVCAAPANASAGCNGGMCGVGMCSPLFGDCDGKAANGCEKNLSADVNNCGGCAKACQLADANPACVQGQCGILSCLAGFADCDMMAANGCEVQTATDPKNCGKCGMVCPNEPNTTPGCKNSMCALACNFGFADCDNNLNNGCEVNTASDLNNCGQCKMVCPQVANGTPGCAAGMCGVASCNNNFGDCDNNPANGCEKNLATDINNCGKCGNVCSFANASAGCLNGQCGILSCNQGFADCDGNPANGCEANIGNDANNCGKCGMVCPMNAPSCVNGACSNSTHAIMQLAFDFQSMPGCGDASAFYTQSFGMQTWAQCELLANQYGAMYIGSPNLSQYNAPYAADVRWVGEADANNGYISTNGWSQVGTAPKNQPQFCILGYANGSMHGNMTFNQSMVSMLDQKTYYVMDFGVTPENTCYSNARAYGARPLNPFAFGINETAHMVENHSCHGSIEYSGATWTSDGNATHSYHCFIGYSP